MFSFALRKGIVMSRASLMLALLFGWQTLNMAAPGPAVTDPAKASDDYKIQGEYFAVAKDAKYPRALQIISLGKNEFQIVQYDKGLPGAGWTRADKKEVLKAKLSDNKLTSDKSKDVYTIEGNEITMHAASGEKLATFKKTERQSPTLGAKPPAGAVVLFDGKDKETFKGGSLQKESSTSDEQVLQTNPGGNLLSKQEFTDFTLHLEFKTPYMPEARSQGRGNSGVYLQNRYELQILDSFGLEGENNECGGFYQVSKPAVNMCLPPLAWQTYDIDFTAAKFDDKGERISPAKVTVKHNGVVIQENLEFPKGSTAGGQKEKAAPGPLQIQDHGNPVQVRNIWVVEKTKS
jgi:hypothetical protein